MKNPISVLIADDHPVFREGLRAVIDGDPRMHVVAESVDSESTVANATELRPDVILMDLSMPGEGGIAATRQLNAAGVATHVLVLTTSEDDAAVLAALRVGARGYLLKSADKETVRAAVVAVANDEMVFGPGVAERVSQIFRRAHNTSPIPFPQLSHREREILELVARGFNNTTIARTLALSEKTVRNNVSNILTKIRVTDRARAIVVAREGGLGID